MAFILVAACSWSGQPTSDPACPPTPPGARVELPDLPIEGAVLGVDYGVVKDEPPWRLLRERGVQFVYLKASKSTVTEPSFAGWWGHAKACGLKRGAYHFLCAPRDQGASESCPSTPLVADPEAFGQAQGKALLTALAGDPGELPPVLDVEVQGGFTSSQQVANLDMVRAAAATVAAGTGRPPVIYGGTVTFHRDICGEDLEACCGDAPWSSSTFWEASYGTSPPELGSCWGRQAWSLWQFEPGTGDAPDWDLARVGAIDGLDGP